MKKILILLAVVAVSFGAYKIFFQKKRFIGVLVFSKTDGFVHESIGAGKAAVMALGAKHGFLVDTTSDATVFNEKDLSKYNIVLFMSTTGDVLNEAQQLEFNRFIQAGGGYVGVHAAADTEYEWSWYGDLVGAYFESHPNNPNVREASIERVDKEHISTKHLPDRWTRTDEWYNYKEIRPAIKVLLNLDETSYEGGTNGKNHPIAWCQEFDGGRSFYTGLGHTNESFAEPALIEHLWGGIQYAAGEGNRVDYNRATVAPDESRFQKVVLTAGLNEPMELEMLPDGRLLFIERAGKLNLYDPKTDSTNVIYEFDVFSDLEDGLLGMALDPKYVINQWIYFFYSPPGEEAKQHISRFTLSAEAVLDPASEKILLEIPTQREECCHSAGSMEFGPDGNLFISLGDNTNPHASDGYAPIDEQEGRSPWDAQKSAANSNDLRGKILRIKPQADGTYSIPAGNLFSDEKDGRPEIYVMGCRNPYRISIDKATGTLYWGEVGPDAGEDSISRGPMGYDEVNQAKTAGFYGWPYFVGNNQAYSEYDFAKQVSLQAFSQEKPVNNSPNNTGAQQLPPAQQPLIWYPYGNSEEFPLVGSGGRNAMAGPVYHINEFPENEHRYPEYYDKKLFTYDWMRGWIMAVTLDEDQNFQRMERFLPSFKFNNPIDMMLGPEGDIYLLEYGSIWFSQNDDARLVRLEYLAGNREPRAVIEVPKNIGAAPLTLEFSGSKSTDYDGDELTYEWVFSGDEIASNEINPVHTFEEPGEYEVKLKVKDPSGEENTTLVKVLVGNELPELAWSFKGNKSFYFDKQSIDYAVEVSDAEDGTVDQGINADDVYVSIDFLERGYDQNEIAMGHQAMRESSRFLLGKNLIEGSDCKTCHQEALKSVGPSYQDIANKYVGDASATAALAQRVIKGGGGVWGEVAMAAHPQLSTNEAEKMVEYILSLSGQKSTSGLPLTGRYNLDKHKDGSMDGTYIFTATYTDKGGQKVGPLTARDVFTLRSPLVPGASFDKIGGAMKYEVKAGQIPSITEDLEIIVGMVNSHVMWEQLDLTSIQSVSVEVGLVPTITSGGQMEFHIDAIDGPIIAILEVDQGLTDVGMETMSTNLKTTSGQHDLYVKFVPSESDSNKPVCIMVKMVFSAEKQAL